MNLQNRLLLLLNAGVFALFVWMFVAQGAPLLRPGPGWEYKDLVAILLSVVSIVVTFIGIIVAVAAIWGYQSIRAIAEQKAEETSRAGCDDYLKSESFQATVGAAIREQIENEVRSAFQTDLGASVLGQAPATPPPPLHPPAPAVRYGGEATNGEAGERDELWRD